MTGRLRSLVALIAFCAAALAAPALEVPLKYVDYAKTSNWPGFRPMGLVTGGTLSSTPPAGLKLPKFTTPKPAFGTVTIAGKSFCIALDDKADAVSFYKRLYFDANSNKDLTDDPPVATRLSLNYGSYYETVNITIKANGKSRPYSFSIGANDYGAMVKKGEITPENVSAMLELNCAYTGEFDLAGKHYRVALADMNCNGTIGDVYTADVKNGVMATSAGKQVVFREGDAFLMTANKQFDANDLLVLGSHLVVGGATYAVRVDLAGPKLILEPVTGKLAALTLPKETSGCELVSADKKTSVMMIDPAAQVAIPPGSYGIVKTMLTKPDAQGDSWCAVAQGSSGTAAFTASLDRPTALKFGEPFTLRIEASKGQSQDDPKVRDAQFTLSITDALGLDVRGVFHVAGDQTKLGISKDKSHPAEPTYIVTKPGGAKLARGQFEYG